MNQKLLAGFLSSLLWFLDSKAIRVTFLRWLLRLRRSTIRAHRFRIIPLSRIQKQSRTLSDCERILLRVPRTQLHSIWHFLRYSGNFYSCLRLCYSGLVLLQDTILIWRQALAIYLILCHGCDRLHDCLRQPLIFITSVDTDMSASLIHELDVEGCVDPPLHIDHVSMREVCPRQSHRRIWWDL